MPRKLALAATGKDEGAFKAWGERAVGAENTKQWGSGKELLNHLAQASQNDCLNKVFIFSHAWPYSDTGNRGGVKLGGPDIAGFYLSPQIYDSPDARYLRDLAQMISQDRINFCKSCEIILTGCRVSASPFPKELARITGCIVIAAKGSSYPKPGNPPGDATGEWISGVGGWAEQQAAKNGYYVGWIKYQFDEYTNEVVEQQIGKKIDNGYLIDLW
ncbi:hypothetical protein ACLIA0_14265 [Bacillaceae bacterium W0354]